jgi:hypothetical protein
MAYNPKFTFSGEIDIVKSLVGDVDRLNTYFEYTNTSEFKVYKFSNNTIGLTSNTPFLVARNKTPVKEGELAEIVQVNVVPGQF